MPEIVVHRLQIDIVLNSFYVTVTKIEQGNMKNLHYLQNPIQLPSLLFGIYIAWQAVRFCYGEVTIPS